MHFQKVFLLSKYSIKLIDTSKGNTTSVQLHFSKSPSNAIKPRQNESNKRNNLQNSIFCLFVFSVEDIYFKKFS